MALSVTPTRTREAGDASGGRSISGPEGARDWKPSNGQWRLASVMMNPAAAGLSVAEKATLAGISERSCKRYLADPRFREWVAGLFRQGVFDEIAPILDAAQRVARVATKDGFNDRRMLLEMAGLVETTVNQRHSGEVKGPAQLVIIEMLGEADKAPESGSGDRA